MCRSICHTCLCGAPTSYGRANGDTQQCRLRTLCTSQLLNATTGATSATSLAKAALYIRLRKRYDTIKQDTLFAISHMCICFVRRDKHRT